MPTITFEYSTETDRVMFEQAVAFVVHMRQVAATAPDGTVIDACEKLALADGRQLLRDSLAAAVQSRVGSVDAKKKRRGRNRKGRGHAGS
jgi:hypothetical protein